MCNTGVGDRRFAIKNERRNNRRGFAARRSQNESGELVDQDLTNCAGSRIGGVSPKELPIELEKSVLARRPVHTQPRQTSPLISWKPLRVSIYRRYPIREASSSDLFYLSPSPTSTSFSLLFLRIFIHISLFTFLLSFVIHPRPDILQRILHLFQQIVLALSNTYVYIYTRKPRRFYRGTMRQSVGGCIEPAFEKGGEINE